MRAGSLDRSISIERCTTTIDDAGTPVTVWTTLAGARAQLLKNAVDDTQGESGAVTVSTATFRVYYLPGLTLADRVIYDGQAFEIIEISEIGRRRGLDLRCRKTGA